MSKLKIVAFMGPKGSYKTTLSNVLQATMSGAPFLLSKDGGYESVNDILKLRAEDKVYDASGITHRESFAGLPKKMLSLFYNLDSGVASWIDNSWGFKASKFVFSEDADVTNRDVLIGLSEFFKSNFGADIWAKCVEHRYHSIIKQYDMVDQKLLFIDDLRYPFEHELVRKYNGLVIRTVSDATEPSDGDEESEKWWSLMNHDLIWTNENIATNMDIANEIRKSF